MCFLHSSFGFEVDIERRKGIVQTQGAKLCAIVTLIDTRGEVGCPLGFNYCKKFQIIPIHPPLLRIFILSVVRCYPYIRFLLDFTLIFVFFLITLLESIIRELFSNSFFYHGTLPQFSCPSAHNQKGVAECKHRHILETTHTLLIASSIQSHFWDDEVSTSVYLTNILPSSTLQ